MRATERAEKAERERDEHAAKRAEYAAEAVSLRARLADALRERDEARRERDERAAFAAAETGHANEWARKCRETERERDEARRERDFARARIEAALTVVADWGDGSPRFALAVDEALLGGK